MPTNPEIYVPNGFVTMNAFAFDESLTQVFSKDRTGRIVWVQGLQINNPIEFLVWDASQSLLKIQGVPNTRVDFQPPRYSNASLPAAGIAGRLVFNTTLNTLQFDTGSAWNAAAPVSGTIATNGVVFGAAGNSLTTDVSNFAYDPTGHGITVAGNSTFTSGIKIGPTNPGFAAGKIYGDSTQGFDIGLITGSVFDFVMFNPGGTSQIMRVPTGTSNVQIPNGSLSLGGSGTLLNVGDGTTGGQVTAVVNSAAASPASIVWGSAGATKWTLFRPGGSNDLELDSNAVSNVMYFPNAGNVLMGANATGAGTVTYTRAGGLQIANPTGGDKGSGVVNALNNYQVNGTPITALTAKVGTGAGSYTTSSASYVDVDGTNLAFTVTVPTGFKILITATASMSNSGVASNNLAIADGTTTLAEVGFTSVTNNFEVITVQHIFTGDGASHTFKLRYLTTGTTLTVANASATNNPRMSFLLVPSA